MKLILSVFMVMAKVPSVVSHFALDALFERPVQAELVELLLLSQEGNRYFTSCVLVHGMGGTGKTVRLILPKRAIFLTQLVCLFR